jgi:hypothetical protein
MGAPSTLTVILLLENGQPEPALLIQRLSADLAEDQKRCT